MNRPAALPYFDTPRKPKRGAQGYWDHRDAVMEARLSSSQKIVLLAILKHTTWSGKGSGTLPCPGEYRIGLLSGLTDRTVRTALVELEKLGALTIGRRPLRTSTYKIDIARLHALRDPRLDEPSPRRRPPRRAPPTPAAE